jgi:hypothetical protein
MKLSRDRETKADDLLREALTDDLPADVAAGMRERIARVRAAREESRTPAAACAWLRRRTVWAALSILILAAGILLQGAMASSPLAERIAALKTAGWTPGQIRR